MFLFLLRKPFDYQKVNLHNPDKIQANPEERCTNIDLYWPANVILTKIQINVIESIEKSYEGVDKHDDSDGSNFYSG